MRSVPLLLILLAAPLAAQQPRFDVLDYHFTLDLPDTGKRIVALAELTVVKRGGADSLALDLVGMTVVRVRVGTQPSTFAYDGRSLRLPVGRVAGDTLKISIDYAGDVADGLIVSTDSAGRWMAFGDNWPNRARHWVPGVDHPSDKATVTWTVWAPSNRVVIANGSLVSERTLRSWDFPSGAAASAGPRTLTEWRETKPIPTYLMVIAAAPLVKYDLGRTACGLAEAGGCVAQMIYTLPEQARFMPSGFAEADSIVTFFSRTFGAFPYEKLAHLQSLTRFGGMENASAIFYSDGAFRRGNVGYGLIAHETAHQWFGDAVTEADWPHLWLSEGFATYLAALYTEKSRGDSAFRAQMTQIRNTVLNAPVVAQRPVIDTIETSLMALLNANSYQKGGWVLHMLRTELGPTAFLTGVRRYYEQYRHRTATTDDFRRVLEQVSGKDLRAFFDQWLRRPGFPEITGEWKHDPATRTFSITISQSGRLGMFDVPVEIEYVEAGGAVRRGSMRIAASSGPAVFSIAGDGLSAPPRSVRLDPDVKLLARLTVRN
jgi:aminopeptidase N